MKLFSLFLLTLLGGTYADMSHMDMLINDRPMTAVSVVPEETMCCLKEVIMSSEKFVDQTYEEELKGPCYFRMSRIYTGNATDYLSKTGQILDGSKAEFLTFLVTIQAPMEVQTYINTIHFEQQNPGTNCSSFRLSRRPTDSGKTPATRDRADFDEPRFFRHILPYDDKTPNWEIAGHQQLEGDDYLLEVPRDCLTDPTDLVIKTSHVFEDAASQARPIRGRGAFIGDTEACSVPKDRAQIEDQEDHLNLIRTLPRNCGYAFQRAYAWHVPETQVFIDAGKTTVMAQLSLNEPMLGDHQRQVTRLSLGRLIGADCAETAIYARKKGMGEESDLRVKNAKLGENDGYAAIYAEAPWEFLDPIYDFRFVLPPGCKIEKPTLRARVVDRKEADLSGGVEDKMEDVTTSAAEHSTTTTIAVTRPLPPYWVLSLPGQNLYYHGRRWKLQGVKHSNSPWAQW